MSRTNPAKKKVRSANRTVLLHGEGQHEEVFLKHLKSLYSFGRNINVKIQRGRGGDQSGMVTHVVNTVGSFDKRFVVLDNDRGEKSISAARKNAREHSIGLIENSPCIEAVLLAILNDGNSFKERESKWCKKHFETKYMNENKKYDVKEYSKIFPKALLDKQKDKVPELKVLIDIISGNI